MVLSQDQQACFRTTKKYAHAQERLYGRNVKILKMTRIFSRKWLNSQIPTVINGWHRQTIDKSYQEEITIFLQQFNLICWSLQMKAFCWFPGPTPSWTYMKFELFLVLKKLGPIFWTSLCNPSENFIKFSKSSWYQVVAKGCEIKCRLSLLFYSNWEKNELSAVAPCRIFVRSFSQAARRKVSCWFRITKTECYNSNCNSQ